MAEAQMNVPVIIWDRVIILIECVIMYVCVCVSIFTVFGLVFRLAV